MTPEDARDLDRLLSDTLAANGELLRQAWERDRALQSMLDAVAPVRAQPGNLANRARAILTHLRLQPTLRQPSIPAPATAAAALTALMQTIARMEQALRTLESHQVEAKRVRDQWYQFW